MNNSLIGYGRVEDHVLPHSAILVLGTGTFWTKQICSLIESEFDSACVRIDSIERASALAPGLSSLRLIIVDEEFAEDMVERPECYFGLNAAASVAFAYREVEVARDMDRRYDGAHGPMGYLPMRVPIDVWLSALRLLLHRERFLPCDLRPPREADDPPPDVLPRPPTSVGRAGSRLVVLTDREREVLSLASVGNSNKVISRKLAISEHTVKLHMHHVYEKLGVANRTAAASLLRTEDTPS
jgi:DNA-binding CsgD family transcriptional regulator